MIPKPHTQPTWLPVRLILLGAAAGCVLLAWRHVPAIEWLRLIAGLTIVSADGTTLATAMGGRAGTTFALVLVSLVIAVSTGFAVAFVSMRLGVSWLAGFVGRLLAALPVVAIAWGAVGVIVGGHGWPVESLLPHPESHDGAKWELLMGRRLWWWLVPCWALALPLTGELISQTIDRFEKMRKCDLLMGLRARGLKPSVIHYRHLFPAVWQDLLDVIQALGLISLSYVVFVEDALGIQGWGMFFATAVKTGDVRSLAGCVYAAGWLAAAWCALIAALRFLTVGSTLGRPEQSNSEAGGQAKPLAASVTSLVLLVISFCAFGEMPALNELGDMIAGYVSPLVHDLSLVASACGVALAIALLRGAMPALLSWRLPRMGILETVSWSPLLVWAMAACALVKDSNLVWIILGAVSAIGGSVQIRNRWRDLQSSRAIEESRAVGTGRFKAWRMHVLPELGFLSLSWILEVGATLMLWLALIDSLGAPASGPRYPSLGIAMASAKENVLADLPPLIVPALIVAISALFFNQLSRIVRHSPPPH